MPLPVKRFFLNNIGLKIAALILALILWFYIVDELNRGAEYKNQDNHGEIRR